MFVSVFAMHLCEFLADAMSNLLGLRARMWSHIYFAPTQNCELWDIIDPDMIYKSAAHARRDSLRDCSEKCLLGQEFQHILSKSAQFEKWMETEREMSTGVDGCRQRNDYACLGSPLCVWGAYCVFGEPSAGLLGISPLLCDLLG